MDMYKIVVILINHFLKVFNISKGVFTSNYVCDVLRNDGKYLIYDLNNNVVGSVKKENDYYVVNASFDDLQIVGMASIIKDDGRDVLKMTYKVKNTTNNIDISGNYISNINDERSKKYLRNKLTTKNFFTINCDGKEIGYIRFYSIKNRVYILNILSDEYVSLSTHKLSHKVDGKKVLISYDKKSNYIETIIRYDGDESANIGVGYKFDDKNLSLVSNEYKKIIDEYDDRYYDFINEEKNLLDKVQEGLFNRLIKGTLMFLNDNDLKCIFDIDNNKGYVKKMKKLP